MVSADRFKFGLKVWRFSQLRSRSFLSQTKLKIGGREDVAINEAAQSFLLFSEAFNFEPIPDDAAAVQLLLCPLDPVNYVSYGFRLGGKVRTLDSLLGFVEFNLADFFLVRQDFVFLFVVYAYVKCRVTKH